METIGMMQKRSMRISGAFSLTKSHRAGSRTVVRIRIVVEVPVELRFVVEASHVGDVVAILAMHGTMFAILHPVSPQLSPL